MKTTKNNQKKRCLSLLKKTYCRLQPSKIDGVGVFAIRDIPKRTSIFCGSPRQNWLSLNKDELKNLNQEIRKMIDDFFISDGNSVCIPANGLNGIDISFFLNYSEKPNCRPSANDSFVTTKRVKKGEELTADYAAYDPHLRTLKKSNNKLFKENLWSGN